MKRIILALLILCLIGCRSDIYSPHYSGDDTTCIQNRIDEVPKNYTVGTGNKKVLHEPGGTVRLGPGDFHINDVITCEDFSYFNFIGSNQGETRIHMSDKGTFRLHQKSNCHDWLFKDITFICDDKYKLNAFTLDTGENQQFLYQLRFKNCTFRQFKNPWFVTGKSGPFGWLQIEECDVKHNVNIIVTDKPHNLIGRLTIVDSWMHQNWGGVSDPDHPAYTTRPGRIAVRSSSVCIKRCNLEGCIEPVFLELIPKGLISVQNNHFEVNKGRYCIKYKNLWDCTIHSDNLWATETTLASGDLHANVVVEDCFRHPVPMDYFAPVGLKLDKAFADRYVADNQCPRLFTVEARGPDQPGDVDGLFTLTYDKPVEPGDIVKFDVDFRRLQESTLPLTCRVNLEQTLLLKRPKSGWRHLEVAFKATKSSPNTIIRFYPFGHRPAGNQAEIANDVLTVN